MAPGRLDLCWVGAAALVSYAILQTSVINHSLFVRIRNDQASPDNLRMPRKEFVLERAHGPTGLDAELLQQNQVDQTYDDPAPPQALEQLAQAEGDEEQPDPGWNQDFLY